MAVSRKDFEAIADAIKQAREYDNSSAALDRVAYLLQGYFQRTNNWFDGENFLKASGSK